MFNLLTKTYAYSQPFVPPIAGSSSLLDLLFLRVSRAEVYYIQSWTRFLLLSHHPTPVVPNRGDHMVISYMAQESRRLIALTCCTIILRTI